MISRYGLDAFGVNENELGSLNDTLIAIIVKHYPDKEKQQIGAMVFADIIGALAQKIDALEDGRSNGFRIHSGVETDILNALFQHGMKYNVKLVDNGLYRAN